MAFSDFPMPEDYPQYLPQAQYMVYLRNYADKFDLKKFIRFNTRVVHIVKATDYESSGRWEIHTK